MGERGSRERPEQLNCGKMNEGACTFSTLYQWFMISNRDSGHTLFIEVMTVLL